MPGPRAFRSRYGAVLERVRRLRRGPSCAGPDRARHAGATEPAVAVRVLGEVLLVVVLGVVEVLERGDLRRDLAVAAAVQLPLEDALRRLGRLALSVARRVDRRAVLGAHVVALAHSLCRVVVLPEALQQRLVARLLRVEDDEHGLGVARPRAADLVVGRVRREAARVPDGRRVDTRRLPEDALRTPEAAQSEHGLLEARPERRGDPGGGHGRDPPAANGLPGGRQRVSGLRALG